MAVDVDPTLIEVPSDSKGSNENIMMGSKVPRENSTMVGMVREEMYESTASRTPAKATALALSSRRSMPSLVRSQVAEITRCSDCLRESLARESVADMSSRASFSEPLALVTLAHSASFSRCARTPSPRSAAKVTACSREGHTCMLMVMQPMTDGDSRSILLSSA
ncbi:MAG: hypothetical protein A4E31_00587 [Methanomassiliicoccales archaeon PtaU1.Bin030]|nr:MAG: hypothetical protein A4E31_00587 [Methanomassiliicoccales archaeon PtaU1.Bin030]